MQARINKAAGIALAALGVALATTAAIASGNHIVVAGWQYPYFAPSEQAAADAQKDFGIASVAFKVPSGPKLELQTELMESLASQGVQALGFFPGDPVGVNSTIAELKANGVAVAALGGCAADPTDAVFCFATDPYKTTYTMTKALIAAMGGKGDIVHLTGLLIDTNTTLREQAVQKGVDETDGAVKLLQTVADTDDPTMGQHQRYQPDLESNWTGTCIGGFSPFPTPDGRFGARGELRIAPSSAASFAAPLKTRSTN
jgi:ribose transport system substrate-binding protein